MQMGEGSTSAAESGSFSFHFTGVMSRIHLDPDWGHRNSLNNRHHMSSEGRMLQTHSGGPGLTWSANRTMMV